MIHSDSGLLNWKTTCWVYSCYLNYDDCFAPLYIKTVSWDWHKTASSGEALGLKTLGRVELFLRRHDSMLHADPES